MVKFNPIEKSTFYRSQQVTRKVLHTRIGKFRSTRWLGKAVVPAHTVGSLNVIRVINAPISAIKAFYECTQVVFSRGKRKTHLLESAEYASAFLIDSATLLLPLMILSFPKEVSSHALAETLRGIKYLPAAIYASTIGINYLTALTDPNHFHRLASKAKTISSQALQAVEESSDLLEKEPLLLPDMPQTDERGYQKKREYLERKKEQILSFSRLAIVNGIASLISAFGTEIEDEKATTIDMMLESLLLNGKKSYLIDLEKMIPSHAKSEKKTLIGNLQKAAFEIEKELPNIEREISRLKNEESKKEAPQTPVEEDSGYLDSLGE